MEHGIKRSERSQAARPWRAPRALACSLSLLAFSCEHTGAPEPTARDAGSLPDAELARDGSAPDTPRHDASVIEPDSGVALEPTRPCNDAYRTHGTYSLAVDGRSEPIEILLGEATSQLSLSVEAEGGSASMACYGLEDVSLDGVAVVPVGSQESQDTCGGSACTQPVRLHADQGFFVLPSALPVAPFERISLRIAMRRCDTLLRPSTLFPLTGPTQVRLRYHSYPAVPEAQVLTLHAALILAAPSALLLSSEAQKAWLDDIEHTVARAFAPAKIDVVFDRVIKLEGAPAKIEYTPDARSELDALHQEIANALQDNALAVPLVLSPCLERKSIVGVSRPLGTTPHLPGACSVRGAAVYAAAERCTGGLSFERGKDLGVIVAHELGHHLGLFHVDEGLTFPSDHVRGTPNLMISHPVSDLTLTPAQVAAIRRHPDLQRAE